MIQTIAVVPTINTLSLTAPLVEHLLLADEVDEVWVYDAGDDETKSWTQKRSQDDRRLRWFDTRGKRIYDLWNQAILENSSSATNVAILNSDIRLPTNALSDMAKLMRSDNFQLATIDPARPAWYSQHYQKWHRELHELTSPVGVYTVEMPSDLIVGWAFMVAAEFWAGEEYAIHPGFEWWYGDDDLFRRTALRGGRICRVVGIGSDHLGSSSDPYNHNKDLKIAGDTELFAKLWQH